MSEILNQSNEMRYDNLVVSSKHDLDVKIVNVASGQGVLKRGTVLAVTSESTYVVCGSELDDNVTATANCIVSDTVDTGSDTGEYVAVQVYISGHFNSNTLIVANEYELTDSDKESLRNAGLFLSSSNAI